ncbi:MAG: lyase family protein [Actinomycetota bacterium]|nr:lyase family protein [Actinomycetota bacterium]
MSLGPGFTTDAMSEVFSDAVRVQWFCRFEAELAAAQAEVGLLPGEVAAAIAATCQQQVDDPAGLLATGEENGSAILAVLDQLRAGLDTESAGWVHCGATTQDVVDTATMLQVRQGFDILRVPLATMAERLAELADVHRDTTVMGRTFLQDARVTTFGAKAARWLSGVLDHIQRMADLDGRLPLQLGGPVGDGASYGHQWPEIAAQMASRLGLIVPVAPWHTDRRVVAEIAAVVGAVASTMAKIGVDVALLAQTGEVRVRPGRSSSMPDKRNPIDSIRAVAAGRVCASAVTGLLSAPPPELERSLGGWHAEGALLPIAFQAAAAAVAAMHAGLASLEVDKARMADKAGSATPDTDALIDAVLAAYRNVVG